VSDPERLLKPKGYVKSTTASTSKKYQPKATQINTKVQVEKLTPERILNKHLLLSNMYQK